MDGKFGDLKQWTCNNGHVLGVIERVEVETRDIRYYTSKLIIFRHAINLGSDKTLEDVDVAGTLHGRMLLGFSWLCSVQGCGCVREWHPDEEAMDWLMQRYKKGAAHAQR